MSQRNGHFLISFLCLTIALHLPLLTYAEAWQEYGKILASLLRFLAALIYSLGIIAFAWIKQKETLKWWTAFVFPLAFFVYWNFITDLIPEKGVGMRRKSLGEILEDLLSFGGLIYLLLITGMCITVWLMIRYYREVIIKYLRK